jgi:hypothetical protein
MESLPIIPAEDVQRQLDYLAAVEDALAELYYSTGVELPDAIAAVRARQSFCHSLLPSCDPQN